MMIMTLESSSSLTATLRFCLAPRVTRSVAGVNQVIGSVNYDTGGVVFYFVWNSNGDHCVMMYSSKENDFVKLYEGDDNLDFERYSHIPG